MKPRALLLVIAAILLIANLTFAGWTDAERVNENTSGTQFARQSESAWTMCVDDSILIQITWEGVSDGGRSVEIFYRAKPLRGEWHDDEEFNVTEGDAQAANPGHSSITTYKDDGDYISIVGYISQNWLASEYKGCDLDRTADNWDELLYYFISEEGGNTLAGATGGAKTGNLINNGDDDIFAAWPYLDTIAATLCKTLWFRTKDDSGWSDEEMILESTSAYWAQDVCPYPDPNSDIHLVYSRSDDGTTYDIYWMKYDFSEEEFGTATKLSDVSTGVKATMPYVVSHDEGDGEYRLHFVWEEKYGDDYRVLYRRYDVISEQFSFPADTLEDDDGRAPTVAVIANGGVSVIWQDINGENLYINKATPPSFNWGTATAIGDNSAETWWFPLLAGDKVGNLHLAVTGYTNEEDGYDVYYFFNDLEPLSPTDVEGEISNNHPHISWTACEEPNFSYYKIYRRGSSWNCLDTTSSTSYTDQTITTDPQGTDSIWYCVTSVDDLRQESNKSDSVMFTADMDPGGFPKFEVAQVPDRFSISQNLPNPFNATTTIRYNLAIAADVSIEIYDILGRRIEMLVNEKQSAGSHQVTWNTDDKPSGMYFYRIQAGEYSETRKMLLIK